MTSGPEHLCQLLITMIFFNTIFQIVMHKMTAIYFDILLVMNIVIDKLD